MNESETIGVCISNKKISLHGKDINLQIWDTAGHERFRSLTLNDFRNCKIFLIVFSVTEPASLSAIKYWSEQVNNTLSDSPKLIVIGNKIDLSDRVIPIEDGQKIASEIVCDFIEISAKTGEGVLDLFDLISDAAYEKVYHTIPQTMNNVSLKSNSKRKKKKKHKRKEHQKKKNSCC
jgi:Ras-related protein Rab-8A